MYLGFYSFILDSSLFAFFDDVEVLTAVSYLILICYTYFLNAGQYAQFYVRSLQCLRWQANFMIIMMYSFSSSQWEIYRVQRPADANVIGPANDLPAMIS